MSVGSISFPASYLGSRVTEPPFGTLVVTVAEGKWAVNCTKAVTAVFNTVSSQWGWMILLWGEVEEVTLHTATKDSGYFQSPCWQVWNFFSLLCLLLNLFQEGEIGLSSADSLHKCLQWFRLEPGVCNSIMWVAAMHLKIASTQPQSLREGGGCSK